MDGRNTRREEPQGPLLLDNVAGSAAEGTTVGRDAIGGLLSGDRQRTLERGDRLEGLLREVSRRIASERAEPRKDKLVELDAEAHWPKKGSREALRRKSWTHPMKGDLRLRSARRRLLTMPEGSPPEASRLMAVPEGRQWRKKDRREKA